MVLTYSGYFFNEFNIVNFGYDGNVMFSLFYLSTNFNKQSIKIFNRIQSQQKTTHSSKKYVSVTTLVIIKYDNIIK